jgi:hypothetical protein
MPSKVNESKVNESKEEDSVPDGPPRQTSKKSRFIPPTVEEVMAYCRQRGNHIDAELFVASYASKGWKVGNSPMKDWKQAVVTWERRDGGTAKKPTGEACPDQYRFKRE